jgi:hypothetical protein
MINALSVERASAALDTMNDVPFFKQKLGKVRAVLAGDSGNQCNFWGGFGLGH